MLLVLDCISVFFGQILVLWDVDWDEFEVLLEEFGEYCSFCIVYYG